VEDGKVPVADIRARGRKPMIISTKVLEIVSRAGPAGLSFGELFNRLHGGSKTTLSEILKTLQREGVVKRDFETARYVAVYPYVKGDEITIPVKLSKEMLRLVDFAAKKLAKSRRELIEESLAEHLQTLNKKNNIGIGNELGRLAELGIAGHLAGLLYGLDRRLAVLERRAGLIK
jgi:DNA-binding Lrp family transcriptional regulator